MCGFAAVPLVIMAASAAYQGYSQNKAAKAEAAQYEYEAEQQEEDAKVAAFDMRKQRDATIQEQMARFGAAGGRADSGMQLYTDTAKEFESDIFNMKTGAKRNSTSLRLSAANARRSGKTALIGGLLGATARAAGNRMDTKTKTGSYFGDFN